MSIIAVPPGFSAADRARQLAVESDSADEIARRGHERDRAPYRTTVFNDCSNPSGVTNLTGYVGAGPGAAVTQQNDADMGPCVELSVTGDGSLLWPATATTLACKPYVMLAASQKMKVHQGGPATLTLCAVYYTSGGAFIATRYLDSRYVEDDEPYILEGFDVPVSNAKFVSVGPVPVGGSGTRKFRACELHIDTQVKRTFKSIDGARGGTWTGTAHASTSYGAVEPPGRDFEWGFHRYAMHLLDERGRADVFELMANAGAKWIRFGIGQPEDMGTWAALGDVDFAATPYQSIIDEAHSYDLKVLGLVGGLPPFIATAPGDPPALSDEAAIRSVYTAMAQQLDGLDAWEIWNEPNLAFFWWGAIDPALCAGLTPFISESLRGEYPDVPIGGMASAHRQTTGGGDMSQAAFVDGFLDANGADSLDYISCHPYPYKAGTGSEVVPGTWDAGYAANLEQVRKEMVLHNVDLPIWLTELGVSVTDATRVITERSQAQFMGLISGLIERRPDMGPVFFHTLDPHAASDVNEGLNLVSQPNRRLRPAYRTLRAMAGREQMNDWTDFGREGVAFANGWIPYITGLAEVPGYRVRDGHAELRGAIRNPTGGSGNTTIATLPPGVRPAFDTLFPIVISGGTAILTVYTGGALVVTGTAANAAAYTQLDGISFEVAA